MSRVVVVGAGVAGLATAALLARDGHEVTVLERGQSVGGRAGSLDRDGFRFDTGPSWYLMPGVYEHFFALMGTDVASHLDVRPLDPAYRVFREPAAASSGAEVVTVPRGRDAVLALAESREAGAASRLDAYLDEALRAHDLAIDRFLYNPFSSWSSLVSSDVIKAAPALARLLGTSLQTHIARRFSDPALRQILGYPAVFLATRPERAPAMYHLMSALDLGDAVWYPAGGFWRVVEVLASLAVAEGVRIVTEAEVTAITTASRRGGRKPRRVTGVTWEGTDGGSHQERADIVVSAADLHHTETRLMGPRDRLYGEPWWRRRVSGPGAVLVMLGVRGELPELPHHSLFFTRDWAANFDAIFDQPTQVPDPASVYVCKPSASDATVAPPGHENLFVLVPVPADVGLGQGGADGRGDATVEAIADRAIDQIGSWAGIPDLRQRIVVRHTRGPADFATDYHSWRGGMLGPAHTLGQSAMFRAQNASRTVDGLFYAGATTAPGVGVPMCLISAELVLKHVRGDRTPGPLPEPGDRP